MHLESIAQKGKGLEYVMRGYAFLSTLALMILALTWPEGAELQAQHLGAFALVGITWVVALAMAVVRGGLDGTRHTACTHACGWGFAPLFPKISTLGA